MLSGFDICLLYIKCSGFLMEFHRLGQRLVHVVLTAQFSHLAAEEKVDEIHVFLGRLPRKKSTLFLFSERRK